MFQIDKYLYFIFLSYKLQNETVLNKNKLFIIYIDNANILEETIMCDGQVNFVTINYYQYINYLYDNGDDNFLKIIRGEGKL